MSTMEAWETKYSQTNDLTKTQIRILAEGPQTLAEAWILSAMHRDHKIKSTTFTRTDI
jgi:hypothetical protein